MMYYFLMFPRVVLFIICLSRVYNRVRFLISQLKNMFWRYSETTIEWGFWFVSEQNYFKHILSLWPSEVSNWSVKKVSRKYSECTTEWRFWLVSKKNNLKRFWVYSRYFCWSESETERGISWISFVRKKTTNWSRKFVNQFCLKKTTNWSRNFLNQFCLKNNHELISEFLESVLFEKEPRIDLGISWVFFQKHYDMLLDRANCINLKIAETMFQKNSS